MGTFYNDLGVDMNTRDGDYWSGLAQDAAEVKQVRQAVESLADAVTQQNPDMGNVRGLVAELADWLLVRPVQGEGAPF